MAFSNTAFSARYRAGRGIRLEVPPFNRHGKRLISPVSYAATQALGAAMRADGVEAFSYVSARHPDAGLAALFEPSAPMDTAPREQAAWS